MPGVPPGRSGRNWLRRRRATAERGREQLDRKLRILFPERQLLRLRTARHRADWEEACALAQAWLLRAALLGGQDAIRTASEPGPVTAHVLWATAMGLSYPVDVELARTPSSAAPPRGNAAIAPAARAFWEATTAGARLAAAEEAERRMDTEIALTRRRLRALDKRLLPRLEESLRLLELSLEQSEQEDAVRLRGAVGTTRQGRVR